MMNYWLMKSEPDSFGIETLKRCPDQTEHWDGIRNYQARNMMRDQMRLGDQIFLYHSSCKEPAIVGIMEVVREAYADYTALNPESKYHDPKSTPEQPRWYMVDVRLSRQLKRNITLNELKQHHQLESMKLLQKGNRLSIMPLSKSEWDFILSLE